MDIDTKLLGISLLPTQPIMMLSPALICAVADKLRVPFRAANMIFEVARYLWECGAALKVKKTMEGYRAILAAVEAEKVKVDKYLFQSTLALPSEKEFEAPDSDYPSQSSPVLMQ